MAAAPSPSGEVLGQWTTTDSAAEGDKKIKWSTCDFALGGIESLIEFVDDGATLKCKKTGVYKITVHVYAHSESNVAELYFNTSRALTVFRTALTSARDSKFMCGSRTLLVKLDAKGRYYFDHSADEVRVGSEWTTLLIQFLG